MKSGVPNEDREPITYRVPALCRHAEEGLCTRRPSVRVMTEYTIVHVCDEHLPRVAVPELWPFVITRLLPAQVYVLASALGAEALEVERLKREGIPMPPPEADGEARPTD